MFYSDFDVMTTNNNNFSNITVTGATIIYGWYQGDYYGWYPKTINGNTFNNWTGGTSPVYVMCVLNVAYGGGIASVSNNTITNITGQNDIYGLYIPFNTGNDGYADSTNISNNTITNLTSTGTGGNVTGLESDLYDANNATQKIHVENNTINTLSSTGASSTVNGLVVSGGYSSWILGVFVNNNRINTLSSSGMTAPTVNGISISIGTPVNMYKNKIYDLSASAATTPLVNGILFSNTSYAANTTAYNNYIGDLRTPVANSTDAIRGINITSTDINRNYNIYYNTVFIDATSAGTNFGTSGIYHTASATATTATLDLRNNIIANKSTPNGTGLTVAYRRSGTALNNYANTSDNNLFYADAPDASRLIFYDGTNSDQTLADYQIRVTPIDTASVTEYPPFISTTGSDAAYLHINGSVATQVESGAVNIVPITDDYDGDIRQGNTGYSGTGTTPDIGADEFNGIVLLPIELLSFTGYNKGNINILNWTTASEVNSDYFTVEKTKDDIHYTFVGQVKGPGNSNTSLHYQLIDTDPYQGTSYYRLKQTDYNGKYVYSDLVPINLNGSDILNIYPNPVQDELIYEIGSTEKMTVQLKIMNLIGQTVFNKTEITEKGINNHTLNVSGLSNGTYSLQVITENKEVKSKQFQIIK